MGTHLPDEVLELLLKLLPLKQRLGSCALVQRCWQAATVAVTTSIELRSIEPAQLARLLSWLEKHGQNVFQLNLTGASSRHTVQLRRCVPCPRLRELHLSCIQLGPMPGPTTSRHGALGVLQACTQLTQLQLTGCTLLPPEGLLTITTLRKLQHLSLATNYSSQSQGYKYLEIPEGMLQQLPQLTSLVLDGFRISSDASLQHISCLTSLRLLQWGPLCGQVGPAAFASLAQLSALTKLSLSNDNLVNISPALASNSQLTGMLHLRLFCCGSFDPASLASMLQLHTLELVGTHPASVSNMLRWLSRLQHLTHLDLDMCLKTAAPAASEYSALTANSALGFISLSSCKFPAGLWEHMFSQEHQLPNLRVLNLDLQGRVRRPDPVPDDLIQASDMSRLVLCCPGLQRLSLCGRLLTGAPLTVLLQLRQLQRLDISGISNESAQHLAQLTTLTALNILDSDSRDGCGHNTIDIRGSAQLTTLRLLSELLIDIWQKHSELLVDIWQNHKPLVSLRNKAPEGSPPDVWSQLAEHCMMKRGCT